MLNFGLEMRDRFDDKEIEIPKNWIIAFHILKSLLEKSKKKKKIIFLDELPWLDAPKSGCIAALENFWNGWASWREDIKLIVCGSATSWIINKLIRNKGGLHNRITHRLLVSPFCLKECEEYFNSYGFRLSRMQVAECYMIMGGIPYYFSLMDKRESLAQNVDRLFFSKEGELRDEFDNLYRSLFKNYQDYVKVIKALAEKGIGLTRQEMLEKTGLENNGEFTRILEELELCGFIRAYLPYNKKEISKGKASRKSRFTLFQLIDFYTLFYLRFHDRKTKQNEKFWSEMTNSSKINAWRGITFEMLCLCQVESIKKALGIGDVSANVCSWIGKHDDRNVQIDLLIDRKDDVINLCEMKFSFSEFVIDKEYAEKLETKTEVFMKETATHKTILLTMITTKGLKPNRYSNMIQRQLILDELF